MPKISFLQIGDPHYPNWSELATSLDKKDDKVSGKIIENIAYSQIERVLGKISDLSMSGDIDSVVFMGDFSTRGDQEGLKNCLNHFFWLCKGEASITAKPQLIGVPGNHDVSRDDAVNLGQNGKFNYINNEGEKCYWNPFPVDDMVHIPISNGNALVDFALLNTTLGSWEKYLLPKGLREEQKQTEWTDTSELQIPMAGDSGEAPSADSSYYDQLDTPYVSTRSLISLEEFVQGLDYNPALVIVGHHNMLPQITPRLSPYAEMLNAGFIRKSITELGNPLLYLHGHVHQEISEILEKPMKASSKVYSIGAPEFSKGFNEISIFFDTTGQPIGFRMLPWRFNKTKTSFRPISDRKVSGPLFKFDKPWPSKQATTLFDKVDTKISYNGKDLLLSNNISEDEKDDLESLLLELYFYRWLDIDNIGKSLKDWVVNRVKNANT